MKHMITSAALILLAVAWMGWALSYTFSIAYHPAQAESVLRLF